MSRQAPTSPARLESYLLPFRRHDARHRAPPAAPRAAKTPGLAVSGAAVSMSGGEHPPPLSTMARWRRHYDFGNRGSRQHGELVPGPFVRHRSRGRPLRRPERPWAALHVAPPARSRRLRGSTLQPWGGTNPRQRTRVRLRGIEGSIRSSCPIHRIRVLGIQLFFEPSFTIYRIGYYTKIIRP